MSNNVGSKVVQLRGTATPTVHAKRRIAGSTYMKGKAFLAASVLLRKHGGSQEPMEYVALHLFCQGIEIILKGLLLFKDYDKYKPKLKKFGHDLEKVLAEVLAVYGLKSMRPAVARELASLNEVYGQHMFRYAGIRDILIDPHTIERKRVFRTLHAGIRLVERELNKLFSASK